MSVTAIRSERDDGRAAGLVWLFPTAIALGAFLLFEIQPLIARYVLPWFGGSIEVWTTCMLFFQVMLLLGYLYTHVIGQALSTRGQVAVHGAVLLAAMAFLPVIPADRWRPTGVGAPTLQILLLLLATTGLPFFALSATSPLMQRWIAMVRPNRNVYRLYALSNAGSLLALVTYPFLVEPYLTRRAQSWAWSVALIAFAAVCAVCAMAVWTLHHGPDEPTPAPPREPEHRRAAKETRNRGSRKGKRDGRATAHAARTGDESARLFWLLLPAAGSMMLLASTNIICLKVVSFPLLWVLPLTVYLLTFIVCFTGERWYSRSVSLGLAVIAGLAVAAFRFRWTHAPSVALEIGVYVVTLFACCMVCHGETYRLRPPAEKLTLFYLLIACGGALGALMVAIVAPVVFPDYWEFYLGMALCLAAGVAAMRPVAAGRAQRWRLVRTLAGGTFLCGGALLVAIESGPIAVGRTLARSRNFYGVLRVVEKKIPARADIPDLKFTLREMWNGPILHGGQFYDAESHDKSENRSLAAEFRPPPVSVLRRTPTTYYGADAGGGIAMQVRPHGVDRPRRIAIIGLGAGTLATYGRHGDTIRFFEINPDVAAAAERYFTFLSDARRRGVKLEVVLGDGRQSLLEEPPDSLDLLVLDAFSGDAIPVHLLTREAFAIYFGRLHRDGVLAIHVTNIHLSLEPEVSRLAASFGVPEVRITHLPTEREPELITSTWVLLSLDRSFLEDPAIRSQADNSRTPVAEGLPWTDDFSSVLRALRW